MLLGDMIAELRRDHRINQSVLAKYLNVSVATISHYESGVNYPDIETAMRLADYFCVSMDYLLGRTRLRIDFNTFKRKVRLPDGNATSADEVLRLFLSLSDQSQVDLLNLMDLFLVRDTMRHQQIIKPLLLEQEEAGNESPA
ncbi:MAG: helix-turn-helix domain-containing protein [Acetanaerobacterium sp.]